MEQDDSPEFENKPDVRPVRAEDVERLGQILETSVLDMETGEPLRDEISEILTEIIESIQSDSGRKFFVATDGLGEVVGMMGCQPADAETLSYAKTDNPLEIIRAFVDTTKRKTGAGSALVGEIEAQAKSDGYAEVIVDSGPRYRTSGWPFWNKMYGEPSSVMKDRYGEGLDAMVWTKTL